MEWYVNGCKKLKEPLFNDISKAEIDKTNIQDYNAVLAELIEDKELDFDRICFIPDYRTRAIAAMLYVDIPREKIAEMLNISRVQLWRITK